MILKAFENIICCLAQFPEILVRTLFQVFELRPVSIRPDSEKVNF